MTSEAHASSRAASATGVIRYAAGIVNPRAVSDVYRDSTRVRGVMHLRYGRASLIAGVAALIGAGACSKSGPVVDEGLKRDLAAATGSDLELAPKNAGSRVVVSAIEGGPSASPKAAPTRTSQPRTMRPVAKPSARVTTRPAPTPSRVVTETAPAPIVAQPAPAPATSRPTPAAIGHQEGRVYKTEAEIFQQMPWIRP